MVAFFSSEERAGPAFRARPARTFSYPLRRQHRKGASWSRSFHSCSVSLTPPFVPGALQNKLKCY